MCIQWRTVSIQHRLTGRRTYRRSYENGGRLYWTDHDRPPTLRSSIRRYTYTECVGPWPTAARHLLFGLLFFWFNTKEGTELLLQYFNNRTCRLLHPLHGFFHTIRQLIMFITHEIEVKYYKHHKQSKDFKRTILYETEKKYSCISENTF